MSAVYLIGTLKPKIQSNNMSELETLQPVIRAIEQGLHQNLQGEKLIQNFLPTFKQVLRHSTWLSEEFKQPHPEYYQQYLLYLDPQERFSIVSFVWGPGQKTPIHNHEVWGVIGVLEGAEISTAYARTKQGFQKLPNPDYLKPGDTDWFTPETGDIHAVENAFDNRVSISVHIYGANIGKVERFTYQTDGTAKPFISGYSNI